MEKIKAFIKANQKYILAIGSAVVIIAVGMIVVLANAGKDDENVPEAESTFEVAENISSEEKSTEPETETSEVTTISEETEETTTAEVTTAETTTEEMTTEEETTTQAVVVQPTTTQQTTIQQTTEQQTTAPVVKQPCPYQDYTQYDFTLEVANEVLTKEAGFPSHFSSMEEVCQWIDKVNGFECFVNADTSKPMYFSVYSITKVQNDPEYKKNHFVNSDCITGDTNAGCFVHSAGGNGFLQYDEVIGFQVEFTEK